jgi:hypothetical protein
MPFDTVKLDIGRQALHCKLSSRTSASSEDFFTLHLITNENSNLLEELVLVGIGLEGWWPVLKQVPLALCHKSASQLNLQGIFLLQLTNGPKGIVLSPILDAKQDPQGEVHFSLIWRWRRKWLSVGEAVALASMTSTTSDTTFSSNLELA